MERLNAAATLAAKVGFEAGVSSQPSIHGRCYTDPRKSLHPLSLDLPVGQDEAATRSSREPHRCSSLIITPWNNSKTWPKRFPRNVSGDASKLSSSPSRGGRPRTSPEPGAVRSGPSRTGSPVQPRTQRGPPRATSQRTPVAAGPAGGPPLETTPRRPASARGRRRHVAGARCPTDPRAGIRRPDGPPSRLRLAPSPRLQQPLAAAPTRGFHPRGAGVLQGDRRRADRGDRGRAPGPRGPARLRG